MKAILLAAGYGRRMQPLTDTTHKCLIDVHGRTIIERIIDALIKHAITDIVIVTGYKHEDVQNFILKKYPRLNVRFIYNERYRETNNIYSMSLAFEKEPLDQDIVLIESDLVIEDSVIQRLIQSSYKNVALVDHYRTGMDGTVVTVEDAVITHVIPPHLQPENFDFSDKFKTLNIYRFSKEFCQTSFKKLLTYYATVIDDNCYYELILGMLIYMQRETIYAEIIQSERWAEVDDPNDLEGVKFLFHDTKREVLKHGFGGFWNYDITDFCFIRNMYFPTGAVISEMKNTLPRLMHNYGSRQVLLDQKLAWFLLCDATKVRVLSGASQIYPLLRRLFNTKKALIPHPTFGEYYRLFRHTTSYSDAVGIDVDDLSKKSGIHECVVIVNPNNPSGTEIPTDRIMSMCKQYPDTFFLVDESFIEFSRYESLIKTLESMPLDNVLVIKSLSKSLGVPGIRLGYVYTCNKELRKSIDDSMPIWNLNSMAEFYLEIILKHRNSLHTSFEKTKTDRELFVKQLLTVPIIDTVYPSGGNFVLVSLKENTPRASCIVDSLLCQNSIYIKDVTDKYETTRSFLRFAVRLPGENEALVRSLSRF